MVTNIVQPSFKVEQRFQTKRGIATVKSVKISAGKVSYNLEKDWYAPSVYDDIEEERILQFIEDGDWKVL